MERIVYLDNSATTYVRQEVLDEMMPYFTKNFGNPSSVYKLAKVSKNAVELAKERIGKIINAKPSEIFFTAGGSEADNWALKGIAFANKNRGNHIITTSIEHPAIINTCKFLERHGFEITYLKVDKDGKISLKELENSIKDTTILISVMLANNEIGTIQPIKEISKIAKKYNIYFHTDAVQGIGSIKINVEELGVDMLSMAAHKFYGPKGIGVLYIKEGTKIENLIHGGGQETGKRAGTENVPAIVGMGKAIELVYEEFDEKSERIINLRDYFIKEIENKIPNVRLNGDREERLPGNINFSFIGVEGAVLLEMLNAHGIYASSGSACSSKNSKPSHVLTAIGLSDDIIRSSLRFTIGYSNTEEDIDYVLKILEMEVKKLRE